jgi:hypothetical protein
MAELNNSAAIGNFLVLPGYDDLDNGDEGRASKLSRYDKVGPAVGHDRMHVYPASFYQIDIYISAPVASTTADSCRQKAPWPLKVWAADLGCESSGGSAATVDLYTDDGTTDASILDAAEDVHTAAGEAARVAPEDGSEDVEYDSDIYIKCVATGGTVEGAQAHLYVQRR